VMTGSSLRLQWPLTSQLIVNSFFGQPKSISDPKMTSNQVGFRVARFFLVQTFQIGKNITNDHKLYQTAINYTKYIYGFTK
jgi:hypothetical protein